MFNVFVKTTTINDTTKVPQTTKITSMILPKDVLGKKSPYPTVVMVMIVNQIAF